MYYTDPEITPHIPVAGDHRFNKAGSPVGKFASAEVEVRAVVEGQAMSKRIHCENIGLKFGGYQFTLLLNSWSRPIYF